MMIRRIFETFDYKGKIEVFEPQRERKEMEVSQADWKSCRINLVAPQCHTAGHTVAGG